ncbi:hypothetical protein PTSG_07444 [Salpingoeca rosetta]|uniref:Peptidase M10 metallopeptidase domain-containing protein n=1 Tax=Salpingoeca rosetta (strain ATCC 50818 / BSB-021) TaxID=946362 RepID=F2UIR0_SALR5|nr:uncharacterized protein PTSG_07444 [Salpingoeca rosetta]EGD77109.1 hypothetical protein PTSG_07444 [Salpingoeca rosetta]|eukprot:XP_004990948.1 hypothetical protein PTSG_07444 [Salpingoeca rosetta]
MQTHAPVMTRALFLTVAVAVLAASLGLRKGTGVALAAGQDNDRSSDPEYVLDVMNRTYFYGVTRPMVERLLNRSGIPHLIDILDMGDGFAHQDNTVVFLGYLSNDSDSGVDALRDYWTGFSTAATPAARRSALLIPHALGLMIQLRQSAKARAFALELLADLNLPLVSPIHRILPKLSSRREEQVEAAVALVKQLVRGLAFDNNSVAMTGIERVRTGVNGLPGNSDLAEVLRDISTALEREVEDGIHRDLDNQHDYGDGFFSFSPRERNDEALINIGDDDTDDSEAVLAIQMTWCQHRAISDPFTSELVTNIADEMSAITIGAQASFDTACCVGFQNGGQGSPFGYEGDGLSVVDNQQEADNVFNRNCGRVKAINALNYCGQPASNVIGCAPVGGDTQILVRLANYERDARLWLHETGHNVGLEHNSMSKDFVMYPTLTGDSNDNFALTSEECGAFTYPPPSAKVTKQPAENLTCDANATAPPNDNNNSDGSGGLNTTTSWVIFGIGMAILVAGIALAGLMWNDKRQQPPPPIHSEV